MIQRFLVDRAVIEYLANALWQIPLLACGGWSLVRIIQPGPRVQHCLWLGVLLLTLLLPLHGIDTAGTPRVQQQDAVVGVLSQIAPPHIAQRQARNIRHFVTAAEHSQSYRPPLQARVQHLRFSATVANGIAMLYVAFLAFKVLQILLGWRAARRLVQHSRCSMLSAQHSVDLQNYCGVLRIKSPQIRESCQILGPVVVGVAVPVLLLPQNFAAHSQEEIKAAFLHELAHIQRRDYLTNLICEIIALPIAWHPAACAVHRRVRRTREMICDAMAARQMNSQVDYAKCLHALARSMLATSHQIPARAQVLGLFSDDILEERVMQLMKRKITISSRLTAARLAGGTAILLAAIGIAAVFHVVPIMAQSQPKGHAAVAQVAPSSPTPATPPARVVSPTDTQHAQPVLEKESHIRRRKAVDGQPFEIIDGEGNMLTPEQQQRIAKELADAQRQLAEATKKLDNPEFEKQIADAQRQVAAAAAHLSSAEFKRQMGEAQRQAMKAKTLLDSREIQAQMKNSQRQLAEATAQLDSPQFQKQMADAQLQAAEAMAKLKIQLKNAPCASVTK